MNNQQIARIDSAKKTIFADAMRSEIEMALPKHVPVSRFQRVLVTSIAFDNRLLDADPAKVIRAALKVAPLGLLTDPMLGEAYLIVDSNKDVQVRVGYRGLMKLARQSGEVASIYAHEVFHNDEFMVALGDKKSLIHKPQMFGDRGEVVGYYAVVKYLNNESDFEIMTIREINAIREKSDGYKAFKSGRIKDTPWHSAYDEMAKKTVLRRLLKRVPASADLADALRHEAEHEERGYSNGLRDITPERANGPVQPEAVPEYVAIYDCDGAEILLQPGEVEQWIKDTIEGATADELEALKEANAEHEGIAAAIEAEFERRGGGEPSAAQESPPPAEQPHEPAESLADPEATRAAGQSQFGKELDEAMKCDWTPDLLKEEGAIMAEALQACRSAADVEAKWATFADTIITMPPRYQQRLNGIRNELHEKFEASAADERQGALID